MGWNPFSSNNSLLDPFDYNGMFGGDDPNDAIKEYMAMLQENYKPYMEAGQNAIPTLEQQYEMLLNNPHAMQQMLGGQYEQSPGYQYQYDTAMNAQNAASAAGGGLGTQAHQTNAAKTASGVANQDYWNYYNANSDLFGKGLSGTQDLYTGGLNATNSLSQGMGSAYGAQSSIAGANQQRFNSELAGIAGLLKGGTGGGTGGGSGGWI